MKKEVTLEELEKSLEEYFNEIAALFPNQKPIDKELPKSIAAEVQKEIARQQKIFTEEKDFEKALVKFLDSKHIKEGLKGITKSIENVDIITNSPIFKGTKIKLMFKQIEKLTKELLQKKIMLQRIDYELIPVAQMIIGYRENKNIEKILDFRTKNIKNKLDFIKDMNSTYEQVSPFLIHLLELNEGKTTNIEQLRNKTLAEKIKLIRNYKGYESFAEVDVDLRNTLAHSHPTINYHKKTITYQNIKTKQKRTITFKELKKYIKILLATNCTILEIKTIQLIHFKPVFELISKKDIKGLKELTKIELK